MLKAILYIISTLAIITLFVQITFENTFLSKISLKGLLKKTKPMVEEMKKQKIELKVKKLTLKRSK